MAVGHVTSVPRAFEAFNLYPKAAVCSHKNSRFNRSISYFPPPPSFCPNFLEARTNCTSYIEFRIWHVWQAGMRTNARLLASFFLGGSQNLTLICALPARTLAGRKKWANFWPPSFLPLLSFPPCLFICGLWPALEKLGYLPEFIFVADVIHCAWGERERGKETFFLALQR